MNGWTRYIEEHVWDVARATACYLEERLRDDLLLFSGTDLHNELSVIIQTALRSYFENLPGISLSPSNN